MTFNHIPVDSAFDARNWQVPRAYSSLVVAHNSINLIGASSVKRKNIEKSNNCVTLRGKKNWRVIATRAVWSDNLVAKRVCFSCKYALTRNRIGRVPGSSTSMKSVEFSANKPVVLLRVCVRVCRVKLISMQRQHTVVNALAQDYETRCSARGTHKQHLLRKQQKKCLHAPIERPTRFNRWHAACTCMPGMDSRLPLLRQTREHVFYAVNCICDFFFVSFSIHS